MIIKEITENLGNILFMLCSMEYQRLINNVNIVYKIRESENWKLFSNKYYNVQYNYLLKHFPVLQFDYDISGYKKIRYEINAIEYNPHELSDNTYIKGYYQSPKYWNNNKEFCKKLLNPIYSIYFDEIRKLYSDVDFDNVIAINVRRGDYLNDKIKSHGFQTLDIDVLLSYINKTFDKGRKFLVVSDDIEWCKTQFTGNNFILGDRQSDNIEKPICDFICCMLCKDNIISNSTYSWWGAYLNIHSDRKVYYCWPWFSENTINYTNRRDIIPENDNWIEMV